MDTIVVNGERMVIVCSCRAPEPTNAHPFCCKCGRVIVPDALASKVETVAMARPEQAPGGPTK